VNGAGDVHLDRLKGRKHISSIMCSLRKPSAYQKRDSKKSLEDSTKRACKKRSKESKETVPPKVQKVDTGVEAEDKLNDSGVVEEEEDEENDEVISDYEKGRRDAVKANALKLLETGLVQRDQAIIIALHFLKVKQVSSVTLKKLKQLCKLHCIPCMAGTPKEDLLSSLGRVLFEKNIVKRKSNEEVITCDNLVTIDLS